tara:strand:- start:2002 stop:2343 length:342 start_codon:yes stop_codon:yes gene_type:complete
MSENKGHGNLVPPKKGEVRNPKGKPKGTKNKSTIFKEMLASKLNGDLTVEQELVTKLYEAMQSGDLKAIDLILNGAYGKDKQVVDNTNVNINKNVELSEEERVALIKDLKDKL